MAVHAGLYGFLLHVCLLARSKEEGRGIFRG